MEAGMTASGISDPLLQWQRKQHYRPKAKRTTLSSSTNRQLIITSAQSNDMELVKGIKAIQERGERGKRIAELPFNAYKSF